MRVLYGSYWLDLIKVEDIQRKALALCLDLPGTMMDVAVGVVPLIEFL